VTALRNLITDIPGVLVGNVEDARLASGVTAIVFEEAVIAAVDVRGGAPGTRDTDRMEPHRTVELTDAIVLSGGSAFGLDACGGVQSYLKEQGRGFAVGNARVPIVPGVILFDLLNGGDKNWGRHAPYRDLGYEAAKAAGSNFRLGTAGAGYGAGTFNLKGGLGSASMRTRDGHTVGALVAVNAAGSVIVGDGPHFWAGPWEEGKEFGGLYFPAAMPPAARIAQTKGRPGENTTIALVATDATLTKAQAKQLAVMAQDGIARAIYPAHLPIDGDTIFAVSTGRRKLGDLGGELGELGAMAANTLTRAIARGVFEATALSFTTALPSWRDRFDR